MLTVDVESVERNLQLMGGKQLSERIMIACAHKLGRQEAHEILRTYAGRSDFVQALHSDARIASVMSKEELTSLLDPHTYIGLAPSIVTSIVAKYGVSTPAPGSPSSAVLTYAQAGVDIEAGDSLVTSIKPYASSTSRPGTTASLGGFGGLFDLAPLHYTDPVLVACTDGVGTKLALAVMSGRHDTIGVDLVAMSVNDLIVQGAEPLFFLDYYATSRLSVAQAAEVIRGIAAACKDSGCALIGGETAELPGMYQPGDYDLAGFAVGAVERDRVLPRIDAMVEGDVVLGLASAGVHSNGYSLVRRIVRDSGVDYFAPPPYPSSASRLCDDLLTPTRLYVHPLLTTLRAHPHLIKGLAHITGGGLTNNLNRVLPEGLKARLEGKGGWEVPAVFRWLKGGRGGRGGAEVEVEEMVKTFNCGVGMCVIVGVDDVQTVKGALEREGEVVYQMGRLEKRGQGEAQVIVDRLDQLFPSS